MWSELNPSLNCVSRTLRESGRDLPRWWFFLHYYCSMSSRYTKLTPILYQIYKEVQMATIIGVMKPWVNVIQCSCLDTSLLVQNKRSHSNFMVFKMFTGDFTRDKTIWILSLVVLIMIYYTNLKTTSMIHNIALWYSSHNGGPHIGWASWAGPP